MRHTHHSTFITTVPLVAGIIGIAAQGCAQKPMEKPIEHTVRKVTPETTPGSAKTEPNIKEEFERSLTLKLERLDEEIREVQAKVANLAEAAKTKWTEKMADLAAKRKAAEAKLDEVRKSAEGAWEHLREGTDRAWEELAQAVQKAREAF